MVGGEPMDTYKARDIFRRMAEAAHLCGDPGIQYDTTINDWHTSATTDRIHASNPCSEYMFLNDTACNLASLNLMKFVDADGEFDPEAYQIRGQGDAHGPGDPGRQRLLPDAQDRGELPQVPPARPGLRQPRRAADEPRPGLRLGRGAQLRRGPDRDHARRGVQAVGDHRPRPRRPVRRVQGQRGPVPARHRQAPRRRVPHPHPGRARGPHPTTPTRSSTTRRSSSARSTAIATRRSPCSRPPARSPS